MLTPHVIEGPEDFNAIIRRKLDEHEEFVERFQKKGDKLILSLDYRKKHGALEAINQAIRSGREDEQLLDEIRRQDEGDPLPQDMDGLDDPEADEDEEMAEDGDTPEPIAAPSPAPTAKAAQ
jgi:hypothetical protein